MQAFRDISSWCDRLSLPKTIIDIAKQLYKRSTEENLLRGKNLDAIIAACIFIACRQAHVPRTFREICNLTHVSKKTLGQCYKALERAFKLSPGAYDELSAASPSLATGAKDLLVRYCNYLDLPPSLILSSYAPLGNVLCCGYRSLTACCCGRGQLEDSTRSRSYATRLDACQDSGHVTVTCANLLRLNDVARLTPSSRRVPPSASSPHL